LSGRGLCDELITRPEESYRLYCVVVCDLETSSMGAPYIYDISRLRVKNTNNYVSTPHKRTLVLRSTQGKTLGPSSSSFPVSRLEYQNRML